MGHPSAPVLAAALAAGELALADGRGARPRLPPRLRGGDHARRGAEPRRTITTAGTPPVRSAPSARRRRRRACSGSTPAQTRMALAVAASQSSGLKENFGTMTKPFHAGHAARSGVLSALLAREGWTASEQALEGPQGFLARARRGQPPPRAARHPRRPVEDPHHRRRGEALSVLRVHALDHRRRPRAARSGIACGPTTSPRSRWASTPPCPASSSTRNPRTGLEAKFSGEFAAAAALVEERVGIADLHRRQGPGSRHPRAAAAGARRGGSRDPRRPRAPHVVAPARAARRRPHARDRAAARCPGIPRNPLSAEVSSGRSSRSARALVLTPDRIQTVRRDGRGASTPAPT